MSRKRNQRPSPRRQNRQHGRLGKLVLRALRRAWANVVYAVRLSLRYLVRSLPYALGAITAMLVPVTIAFGYRYVIEAPDFGVAEVLIEGNHRVSAERILRVAGVENSPNLLALDLSELESRLMLDPWIRSARVERRLPDKLIVTVSEHEPAALIALGALYLVDERGRVFKRVEPGEHFEFSVLTGLTRQDLGPDAPAERVVHAERLVRGALKLLQVWAASDMGAIAHISEVHMDPLFGYTLVLGSGSPEVRGAVVRLGTGEVPQKLDRLKTLVAVAVKNEQRLGEVRLNDERDPRRVAVRFRPLPAVPQEEGEPGGQRVEGKHADDRKQL